MSILPGTRLPRPPVSKRIDPRHILSLAKAWWPDNRFYDRELELIEATLTYPEVYVKAGNKLGKDYTASFIALACFLICQEKGITCRIVTTSVAEHHLKTLWGEIGRWIATCKHPLINRVDPHSLVVNYQEVRRRDEQDVKNPLNFLVGRVSAKGEGLAGHHAEFTLLIGDEASGIDDEVHKAGQGWAQHMLWIGNPNHCENFYRKAFDDGESPYRKLITIRAEDSPNVRRFLGRPTGWDGAEEYPNVLSAVEYQHRRATWDAVRQCVGLDGEFYKGPGLLLFPPLWLDRATRMADALRGRPRKAKGIGIDPAAGGDLTAMAAVDEMGLIELVSRKTPDTNVVVGEVIAFAKKHQCPWDRVCLDRGGGKEHADRLRAMGYPVKTVAFGASPELDLRIGRRNLNERKDLHEEKYTYVMMRSKLYHELSLLLELDQAGNPIGGVEMPNPRGGFPLRHGFAIPGEYTELRKELAVFPKLTDEKGRYYLPPKDKKDPNSTVKTLKEMIGHSPDRADALAISVYMLLHGGSRVLAECSTV